MKLITATCMADEWTNETQVREQLLTVNSNETVVIECVEGFSITHAGLLDAVLAWQKTSNHPLHQIKFKSVNQEDVLPFKNIHPPNSNGCWPMSKQYWTDTIDFASNWQHLFGLFIGRSSVARNVIMWECAETWTENFVFSRLKFSNSVSWHGRFENIDHWLTVEKQYLCKQWFENHQVPSLDDAEYADQFDKNKNTNLQLLNFYPLFAVEIVCETMTLGSTFFPTEKTVRPIIGVKPFIVYGPANYLKNLRKMGFRTFNKVWDEGYDDLSGPARWHAMKIIIQDLINHPAKILDCYSIVKYNKQLLSHKLNL